MTKTWADILKKEKEKDYFKNVLNYSLKERSLGKDIYPPKEKVFEAFKLTPFDKVKVVILGQDPYHGPRRAEGLSFSVPPGIPTPPSLKNIYKEIEDDLGIKMNFQNGHLKSWAEQGVLLLNSVLTVEMGRAASHSMKGWEQFTDFVIKQISEEKKGVIFILWGNYARAKKTLIDSKKHFILESQHPSPFSAYSGFFGSKPFSKTNKILEKEKQTPIDWQIK